MGEPGDGQLSGGEVDGRAVEVEGLALRGVDGDRGHPLAAVDADEPGLASPQAELTVTLG